MNKDKCDWCAHAGDCKRKANLRSRTVTQGGITGLREAAKIEEIIVSCIDFEPLPYKSKKDFAEEETDQ